MEVIDIKNIKQISKKDLKGKIIVFHTDTVYGVGALYQDEEAENKIYEMKQRSISKLLPVLCASVEQVKELTSFNEKAEEISKYWPGALTMILNKKNDQGTLAVRIPDSEIALAVLNHFGPLSTTSVNISNEKELNTVKEISERFSDWIDYLVINESVVSFTPSPIVDLTSDELKIIRNGSIKLT